MTMTETCINYYCLPAGD